MGSPGRWCRDRCERPYCWSPSSPFISAVTRAGSPPHPYRQLVGISARDANRPGRGYRVRTLVGMAETARRSRREGLRRLRWRMSGAWLWPTFVVVIVLEAGLLHWLPIAGGGSGRIAGAAAGGLAEPHRDRRCSAGSAASCCAAAAATCRRSSPTTTPGWRRSRSSGWPSSSPGIVHRPELQAEREAFSAQSLAARLWVRNNGDEFARAHVDAADSVLVDTTCTAPACPDRTPSAGCVSIIDTSRRPPRVRRDRSRESNASQNPRGVFR